MHHIVIFYVFLWVSVEASGQCPQKCNCDNRSIIQCNSAGITTIPKRISRNAEQFFANNNTITELPDRMLINGNKLQKLSISRNQISSLKIDNFGNTPNLILLDLSYNNITTVPNNAFFGLTKLRILRLNNNDISELWAQSFQYLVSVKELTLSDNLLSMFPDRIFASVKQLEVLTLDGNQIISIQNGMFKTLTQLQLLNLSRNRIHQILTGTFKGLSALRELHLHDNLIEVLDGQLNDIDTACSSRIVRNFSISETMAGQQTVFGNMKELQTIDLRSNLLKGVKLHSFTPLRHLTTLGFGGNSWRCDCTLKKTIQHLRSSNPKLYINDVVCVEPNSIKDFSLHKLSFYQIARAWLSNSSKLRNFSMKKNRRPSARNRPYGEPVTQLPQVKSGTQDPTSRSQIRVRLITTTTSYVFLQTAKNQNTIVRAKTPKHKKVLIDGDKMETIRNVRNQTARKRNATELVAPKVSKNKVNLGPWIIASIVVSSMIAIIVCIAIAVKKTKKKCEKSTPNSRSIISSPSLHNSHRIAARRPLPKAPSTRQVNTDAVRWTNGGTCIMGSNSSSFVSTQIERSNTPSNAGSNRTLQNVNISRDQTTPVEVKSKNIYNYVENCPFMKNQEGPNFRSGLRLPPLPCSNPNLLSSKVDIAKKSLEVRKRMNERRKMRQQRMEPGRPSGIDIERNNIASHGCSSSPPPPPKRNESSRARCRELMKSQGNNFKKYPEYCEIDQISENLTRDDSVESVIFKKYIEKILTPDDANQPQQCSPIHFSTKMSQSRKKLDDEISQKTADLGFKFQEYTTLNSKDVISRDKESHSYDKLMFCSVNHISHGGENHQNCQNLKREACEDGRNILFSDIHDLIEDLAFKKADDDFIFSCPQLGRRKSYPKGLFGSDQHLLDSLREQDLGQFKPRHHTAPSQLDHLTLPLSEISSDEDLYDVFDDFHYNKKGNFHKAESESTILSSKPTFSQKNPDSFVYSMAQESPVNVVPKIIINDNMEGRYQTVKYNFKTNLSKSSKPDDGSNEYHHLQFMCSGILGQHSNPKQSKQEDEEIDLTKLIESFHPDKYYKEDVCIKRKSGVDDAKVRNENSRRYCYVDKTHLKSQGLCSIQKDDEVDTLSMLKTSEFLKNSKLEQRNLAENKSDLKEQKLSRNTRELQNDGDAVVYQSREREIYLNAIRNSVSASKDQGEDRANTVEYKCISKDLFLEKENSEDLPASCDSKKKVIIHTDKWKAQKKLRRL